MRFRRSAAKLRVLKAREASIFAAVTDAYCGPGALYPPVSDTDAVAFADELTARLPQLYRVGFRAALQFMELGPLLRGYSTRFLRLDSARRTDFIRGLNVSRLRALRLLSRVLKFVTMMAYYGDDRVMRAVGYDPDARIERGRALRKQEGRP